MTKLKKEKLMAVIKSGDFSIITWDQNCFSIYEGNHDIDTIEDCVKPIYESCDSCGYMPKIVALLTEALGGQTSSI